MSQRIPVTRRLADAMQAASQTMPRATEAEDTVARETEANEARRFLGRHLREYASAIVNACMKAQHRGAKPATHGMSATPCVACSRKVKNIHEAAGVIEPDRASG